MGVCVAEREKQYADRQLLLAPVAALSEASSRGTCVPSSNHFSSAGEMDHRARCTGLLLVALCLGTVGADDNSVPCDSSCTSCMSCDGGTAYCTCTGTCVDGSSPTCSDDDGAPMCECDDGGGDDDDDFSSFYWSWFIPALIMCWVIRCLRAACRTQSGAGAGAGATHARARAHNAQAQRERLLAQAIVAAAVADSARTAQIGRPMPDAPVVVAQAVPVHAAPPAAVEATVVSVAGVDQSVDSPAVAVAAEPAMVAHALQQPSSGYTCRQCGKRAPEPRGNFCSGCGMAFGSE